MLIVVNFQNKLTKTALSNKIAKSVVVEKKNDCVKK